MSITIHVTLDGDPLPNRTLWLLDGTTDVPVTTDDDGDAQVDDSHEGVALKFYGPDLFNGWATTTLSATGGSLVLELEKGWEVPDSPAPANGKIAVAVMVQNDWADLTQGGYLLKNHKVSVEDQSSQIGSIFRNTDDDGFVWLAEDYVGTKISFSAEMANDDQYGGNWLPVGERGSIGLMAALYDFFN